LAKLIYSGKDDLPRTIIHVHSGEQFFAAIKALKYPCGGKKTVLKNFEQLINRDRKSAYGWKIA